MSVNPNPTSPNLFHHLFNALSDFLILPVRLFIEFSVFFMIRCKLLSAPKFLNCTCFCKYFNFAANLSTSLADTELASPRICACLFIAFNSLVILSSSVFEP